MAQTVDVDWPDIVGKATIRTHLKSENDYVPRGKYDLILPDGEVIDLGDGGKFIDDWGAHDDAPTCQEHMEASGVSLAETPHDYRHIIQREQKNTTLSDFLDIANFPTEPDKNTCAPLMKDSVALYKKQVQAGRGSPDFESLATERREVTQALRTCERGMEIWLNFSEKPDVLARLIAADPPLITVVRSTYYVDHMVWDAELRKFHLVSSEGC